MESRALEKYSKNALMFEKKEYFWIQRHAAHAAHTHTPALVGMT